MMIYYDHATKHRKPFKKPSIEYTVFPVTDRASVHGVPSMSLGGVQAFESR